MESNESAVIERPKGSVKHPVVATALASVRIVFFSLRHGGKSAKVDYSTGDVWVDGK